MKKLIFMFVGFFLFSPTVYSVDNCHLIFADQDITDPTENDEIKSFYSTLKEQLSENGLMRLNNIFVLAQRRSFDKDPLVLELISKLENAYKAIERGYYASSFQIENGNTYLSGRIESAYGETKLIISSVVLNDLQYNENLNGVDFRFSKILYGFLHASQKIWVENKNANQITLVAGDLANQKLKQLLADMGLKGNFDLNLKLQRNH